MSIWPFTNGHALRSRAWMVAPVVAVAATLAATPCDCPEHDAAHVQVAMAASHQMAAHSVSAASTGEHTHATAAGSSAHHGGMAFEVGTAARPIITRSGSGPLWKASKQSAPGSTKHGTYAEQAVAAQLARLRQPAAGAGGADDLLAQRTELLTTAQATKKLSARCQRLIKRRKSSLSKADRKRRADCLTRRRKLVAASKATGVTAPAAPIKGPVPTVAPPTTAEPTTPAATTPVPTTPITPTTPAKKYAAAGVIATDGLDPFKLSRPSATADIVNFELDNTDRQQHDLYIAPASATGEITGALVKVIGRIDGGTRESADVELAPGRYKLLCTVDGHGPMAVNFTVYAPPTP